MKYCFGPVPSRRLGLSLGVDIVPYKTCNLNCVYCELGPTEHYATERKEYMPVGDIRRELETVLERSGSSLDVVTFTGSGEPTLHAGLGVLLDAARKITDRPLAVLTNATLINHEDVRRQLSKADIVLPSLDSVNDASFRRVNRPAASIHPQRIVEGLCRFRREFRGELWLEILFVRGLNSTMDEVRDIKEACGRIKPDRIQINTVVRPPAIGWARPLEVEELENIKTFFGERAEIVADFSGRKKNKPGRSMELEILETLRRRPLSLADLEALIGMDAESIRNSLDYMIKSDFVTIEIFDGTTYYRTGSKQPS